jgi:DNA-binding MarR family transcriptional regulator
MAVAAPNVEQLAMRVRQSTMRLRRRLRTELPSGLSQTDFSALSTVIREGRIGLGELAQREGVKPPSMTRIAAALERDALVARRTDPADRRRAWLEATPSGRRLVERNRRQRDVYLATVLRELPLDDLVALERGVAVLEHLVEMPR